MLPKAESCVCVITRGKGAEVLESRRFQSCEPLRLRLTVEVLNRVKTDRTHESE